MPRGRGPVPDLAAASRRVTRTYGGTVRSQSPHRDAGPFMRVCLPRDGPTAPVRRRSIERTDDSPRTNSRPGGTRERGVHEHGSTACLLSASPLPAADCGRRYGGRGTGCRSRRIGRPTGNRSRGNERNDRPAVAGGFGARGGCGRGMVPLDERQALRRLRHPHDSDRPAHAPGNGTARTDGAGAALGHTPENGRRDRQHRLEHGLSHEHRLSHERALRCERASRFGHRSWREPTRRFGYGAWGGCGRRFGYGSCGRRRFGYRPRLGGTRRIGPDVRGDRSARGLGQRRRRRCPCDRRGHNRERERRQLGPPPACAPARLPGLPDTAPAAGLGPVPGHASGGAPRAARRQCRCGTAVGPRDTPTPVPPPDWAFHRAHGAPKHHHTTAPDPRPPRLGSCADQAAGVARSGLR